MTHEVSIGPAPESNDQPAADAAISCSLPIARANAIIQAKLSALTDDDIDQTRAAINEVTDLVQEILGQAAHPGTADDWHNFAVDVAKQDLFDLSCDILDKGLTLFPKDTDLLADYLQYGIACGRIEKCRQYYRILAKIPKVRYTWRAYSFAVHWLQYLWERSDAEKEMLKLQQEMLDLAAMFRKNIPDDEESYRCAADIYQLIHNRAEEEKVLRAALVQFKIAPKCALRLADMLFARGEYEDALVQIQRGINDAMQTQASVNEGYLYYLLGLSKMAVAMRGSAPLDEAAVTAIYADFEMALRMDNRAAYRRTMETKAKIISSKSGIPVDDSFHELAYLVQAGGQWW